mgnify:CR=1 FL=1
MRKRRRRSKEPRPGVWQMDNPEPENPYPKPPIPDWITPEMVKRGESALMKVQDMNGYRGSTEWALHVVLTEMLRATRFDQSPPPAWKSDGPVAPDAPETRPY